MVCPHDPCPSSYFSDQRELDKKNERLEQDLANQRKQLLALEFEHEQLVSSSVRHLTT